MSSFLELIQNGYTVSERKIVNATWCSQGMTKAKAMQTHGNIESCTIPLVWDAEEAVWKGLLEDKMNAGVPLQSKLRYEEQP